MRQERGIYTSALFSDQNDLSSSPALQAKPFSPEHLRGYARD